MNIQLKIRYVGMYTSTSNISTQCQNVRLDCRAHFRIIYVGNQTQYRSGKVRFVTLDIVLKCPLCQTMLIDGCDKINIATKSRLRNAQRVRAAREIKCQITLHQAIWVVFVGLFVKITQL